MDCCIVVSEIELQSCNFGLKPCKKVKLTTVDEGDPKAPFSNVTTPTCRGGRYSFHWIALLYLIMLWVKQGSVN